MPNSYFRFKKFTIHQDRCALKVTTDACLFGAWIAGDIKKSGSSSSTLAVHDPDKEKNSSLKGKILDIGTGTGLLPLMIVQHNPNLSVDAIEIDQATASQAAENLSSSPWSGQLHILQADIREVHLPGKYDIIVSNPPFYEKDLKSADEKKNIACHGHSLNLRELIRVIRNNLAAGGCFYLLLPYKRYEEIKKMLNADDLQLKDMVLLRQSPAHGFFRMMVKGRLKQGEIKETNLNEITIWDDTQNYTPEFIELLRDYYLRLH